MNENLMTAVTLDTNDEWLPEMSLCNIDYKTHKLIKVQPLHFGGDDYAKSAEKNWLVLKYLERNGSIHLIHSYDPLRIVSVDINNGYSSLISMKRIFHLNGCENTRWCMYLFIPFKTIFSCSTCSTRPFIYVFPLDSFK